MRRECNEKAIMRRRRKGKGPIGRTHKVAPSIYVPTKKESEQDDFILDEANQIPDRENKIREMYQC